MLATRHPSRGSRGAAHSRSFPRPLGVSRAIPAPEVFSMPMNRADKIWMDGKWVAWDDARIHILSHVAHYATAVFEGIRAYETPRGTAIFRLPEHVDRLMFSARVYRMDKDM